MDVVQGQNAFFGNRPLKKAPAVHIKDDFNPFKQSKVAEASAVGTSCLPIASLISGSYKLILTYC